MADFSKCGRSFFRELDLAVHPDVYEPAEDSFMLAEFAGDAGGRTLDVGTGCGIVALAARKYGKAGEVIGVDANPAAVENAKYNAERNGLECKFIVSDLFEKLKNEKFDTVYFNPPYLPTTKNEKIKGAVNDAFDGGVSGRKVTEKFVEGAPKHLSRGGRIYMLASSLSGIEKIIALLRRKKFIVRQLAEKKLFFERLVVLEAAKVK